MTSYSLGPALVIVSTLGLPGALSPQRRRGSVKASEVIKGDKVGARGANERAASCSSLGEKEYGGAARRRKSRDMRIRSVRGPGLHQGVLSTARRGVRRVIAQDSEHKRGPSPLGRLSSVALTKNSEP